jgi:hypothetical protein
MLSFLIGVVVGSAGYRYLSKNNPAVLDYLVTKANSLVTWFKGKFK